MAGSALSPVGTLSYNGFTFSSPNTDIASFDMTPVMDDANRTVAYCEYTIGIVTMLQSDAPTTIDATMADAQKRLGRNGGILTATGLGLANFEINTGSVRDVKWGPICRTLKMEMRGPYACRLMWVVQFALPHCTSGTPKYTNAVLAFNYATEWAIDRDGYTTVTRSGYIEIPMTRIGVENQGIPDTADTWRGNLVFPRFDGFERTHRFSESPDKRRLSFTITDTELATVPPEGFTDFNFDHSVRTKASTFTKYNVNLSVSGTLAADASPTRVLEVWERIYSQYVRPAGDLGTLIAGELMYHTHKAGGIPTFAIDFSFDWIPVEKRGAKSGATNHQANITKNLKILDMPVYGAGSQASAAKVWKESMAKTQTLRGRANIKADKTDDKIIDLCTTQERGEQGLHASKNNKLYVANTAVRQFEVQSTPTPAKSWDEWSVVVELYPGEPPYVVHHVNNPVLVNNSGGISGSRSATTATDVQTQVQAGMVITATPSQTWFAKVTVNAMRMDFPIPDLNLDSIGTNYVVLARPLRRNAAPRRDSGGNLIYIKQQEDIYLIPGLQHVLNVDSLDPADLWAAIGPANAIPEGKEHYVEVISRM